MELIGFLYRAKTIYEITNEIFRETKTKMSYLDPLDLYSDKERDRESAFLRKISFTNMYIHCEDGKFFRVHTNQVDEELKEILEDQQGIRVSFTTTDQPRGKFLWARKVKIAK